MKSSSKHRNDSVKPKTKVVVGFAGVGIMRSIAQEYKDCEKSTFSHQKHDSKSKPNSGHGQRKQSSQGKPKAARNPSVSHPNHGYSSNHSIPSYTNPFDKSKAPKHTSTNKPSYHSTNLAHPDPHTEDGREKIAKDTMKIINDGKYEKYDPASKTSKTVSIANDLKLCISRTETFGPKEYENKQIHMNKHSSMCEIKVIPVSSYGAAKYLVNHDKIKNTCVLNFASATKPGGGFLNGRQAQEESLSRQSALYASIKGSKMYVEHGHRPNDNYYTDYMIYSPNVPVFRNDQDESLLPPNEYFTVNVITSAAPNKTKIDKEKYSMNSKPNLNALIQTRIRKIVKCAIDKKNDALVLGAYGCGVFGNDPKDISKLFKNVLVKEGLGFYLHKVVFAITGPHSENFKAFSAEFS